MSLNLGVDVSVYSTVTCAPRLTSSASGGARNGAVRNPAKAAPTITVVTPKATTNRVVGRRQAMTVTRRSNAPATTSDPVRYWEAPGSDSAKTPASDSHRQAAMGTMRSSRGEFPR